MSGGQANRLPTWARYTIAVLAQGPFFAILWVAHPRVPLGDYRIIYAVMLIAVVYLLGEGPAIPVFVMDTAIFACFFLPHASRVGHNTTFESELLAFALGVGIVGIATAAIVRSKRRSDELAEALKKSEEDLNRAQSVARTGSWRLDVRRDQLVWSDETYRLFGIAPGTPLTYESFLANVHPDDREYVDTQWQAALRGEDYDIEHRIIVNGEARWVRETAVLEFDDEGALLGGFGTVQDITERKRVEETKDRLLEREHRIAEALQQALIPSQIPVAIGNWSVAARYQPALEEARVGGDFYDVFELGEGKCGVLIGDIAGKGLAAAMRVAAVRHAIRSYAYMHTSPADVMRLANEALCKESADEQNVLTAFFAVIDIRDNSVVYANAGHEPPVMRSRDGRVVELDVTGPMLGIVADSVYCERSVWLEPGDEIVMFTDGITEARKEGVLLQKEGVIRHLNRLGDATSDEIAQGLLQSAIDYAGGSLQDDAAIVVLEYKE